MHLEVSKLAIPLLAIFQVVGALFEPPFVSFQHEDDGRIDISRPTLIIDRDDYSGVHIAAEALAQDFGRVTGTSAPVVNPTELPASIEFAVILGSVERSNIIQQLVDAGQLDVSAVAANWESFVTAVVRDPLPGVREALVIAGSDKRGTIYGVYTLSEQIGVSPWYWWADVVPRTHDTIYALPNLTIHGEPSVRYRGIFLNDEAPALTSWVLENFGDKFNSAFYAKLFELLLRLKANYLWPAMWPAYPEPGNSFFVDDPLNQKLADDFGIVVSTSHHEPMQRATNEWITSGNGSWSWTANEENITNFFVGGAERARGYESYFTMGMRGEGDSGLVGEDPVEITRDVITTERSIIANTYGNETAVRQVLALYKEVQVVYEAGLEIPDDVTLLFADDNYGNVRRLPTPEELQRPGGLGLYYHLEYVGSPRSYKWINTNSLGKVQQQLSGAHARGVDRIWVINVADLKPMETPLSMIMAMAWNISSVTAETIPSFLETYAIREFPEEHTKEIAQLLLGYSRLVGLRRHESIETSTFSLLNYNEAERVLEKWADLLSRAEKLDKQLDESFHPSFFQLVLHPIKASHTFVSLKIAQAQNSLYATQRRNSANAFADQVLNLFEQDFDIQEEYHSLLDNKWNHIMRQPHYNDFGNTPRFHTPIRDMVTGLSYVQLRQNSSPSVGQAGVSVEGTAGVRPGLWNEGSDLSKPSRKDLVPGVTLPVMDPYGPDSRWFDVYTRGIIDIDWSASPDERWVALTPSDGHLSKDAGWDTRVTVTVDWSQVPEGYNQTTLIHVNGTDGYYEQIRLPVHKTQVPNTFRGFVEGDRHVAIDAAHFFDSSEPPESGVHYEVFPHLSRTLDGPGTIGLMPHKANITPAIPDGPWLEYPYYQFTNTSSITVTLFFTTTLDTDPSAPLMYGLSLDSSTPNVTRLMAQPAAVGDLPANWAMAVVDNIWRKSTTVQTPDGGKGEHRLRYWAGAPNVLLERIIIDMGGVRTSYLGPPESRRVGENSVRPELVVPDR